MTITLKHTSGDTILCHGTGHRGEAGYFTGPVGERSASVAEWAAQVSRPIRAKGARPLDRGNGVFAFGFAVERRFLTEDEARVFELTFAAGLPRFGAWLEVGGIGAQKVRMAGAVLERVEVGRVGVSCDVRFEFTAGMPELVAGE